MDSKAKLFLAAEFLDSSSSCDDELYFESLSKIIRRKKPKIRNYIYNVILKYTNEEVVIISVCLMRVYLILMIFVTQFKRNLRLNKESCTLVISMFKQSNFYKKYKDHGGIEITSAEKHIYSFLWFAGNKVSMRNVAELFDLSESTFLCILFRVMNFLNLIAPTIINFPNSYEALQKSADEFIKISGFPNVVGCIDGTYINIRTPAHKIKSTYVNRHDMTSLTLQGICDHKKKFIDVFTGTPGKLHDSRIYDLSFISKKIPQILGKKFHLLGDAAYPISENIITPYRDYGNLTNTQTNFNYKFSATRVLIENTFGILKARFRQLMKLEFHKVENNSKFIISCCVLHNLCIENNDLLEEDCAIDEIIIPVLQNNNEVKRLGEEKRNRISDFLGG